MPIRGVSRRISSRSALSNGAVLAASFLAASPSLAATHLIAIGNNQGHSDEPLLRFAEKDAQDLANVLRRLGRVSPENSLLMLGDDAEALRRVILKTNVKLRTAPSAEGDALILYYSGHADATGLHLGSATLPYEELKALVEGSPAKVRLLIVDSCHSGGITAIKGAVPAEPFAIHIDHRLEAEGLAIITSSSGSEDAQESVDLRASFFTHHFVTALRGAADADRDGRISLNEAYAYAYRGTIRSSGRTTKLQHPTYLFDLKGKGDFSLSFPKEDGRGTGRLSISAPGSYLVMEGTQEDSVAAELVAEDGGTQILLPPGPYLVRQRSDSSYREYAVDLAAGEDVDLSKLEYKEVAYARLLRKGGGARETIHGVSVMAGAAGSVVDGYGPTPHLSIGYSVDFPALSLGLEGRFGLSDASPERAIRGRYDELALRLRAERFIDLDAFSFSLGLLVEGVRRSQSFESRGVAPDRVGYGLGFGGILTIERDLGSGFALRIEGGPVTHVLPRSVVEGGAAVREELATPFSWWAALGGRFSL
ncbi:MAG: caspase family protein [Deltaproteobacteria bacterium]|nr:caspase family protein [Deltaproteobacteria bacterium]